MNFDDYMGILFKGCIPLKGGDENPKAPISKNWQNMPEYPSYSELDAKYDSIGGVLCDNVICIDIDEMEQAERILKLVENKRVRCLVIRSTRGMHFYFMNNSHAWVKTTSHIYCAIGLLVDPRSGEGTAQMVLKLNGKEREVIYHTDDIEELPFWLYPVDKIDRKLVGMGEGERNQTLWDYRFPLTQAGLSIEQIRTTFHIINRFIFSKPMKDREIDEIARAKAFDESFFKKNGKGRLNHHVMGDIVKADLFVRKTYDGEIYSFNGAVYVEGVDNIGKCCIDRLPTCNITFRKEVSEYVRLTTPQVDLVPSDKYVCFKNGLMNLETWTLEEFNPAVILFNQIPWNYNPDAYNNTLDVALDKWCCNDKATRLVLEEFIGYCHVANTNAQVSLFINGMRRTGKSTFVEFIGNYFGKANVESFSLTDTAQRFSTANMKNKLLNYSNDINTDALNKEQQATFKKLVTGDVTKMEEKFKKPMSSKPYCKLIFSCNGVPYMGDDEAIGRRMLIIPFSVPFDGEKDNRNLKSELYVQAAYEYMGKLAIEGLRRLVENGYRFSRCDRVDEEYLKSFLRIDSVDAFLNSIRSLYTSEDAFFSSNSQAEINKQYRHFCSTNYTNVNGERVNPASRQTLTKRINERFCRFVGNPVDGKRYYIKRI